MDQKYLINKLDEISLSSSDVENIILNYSLAFLDVRRSDVEWQMAFPTFIHSFYAHLTIKKSVPTQEGYWQYYLSDNSSWFKSKSLDNNQMIGLKARIYRTYPSLVRDIHFALFLKESKTFDDVIYNESCDVEHGIDLIVKKSGLLYAINLFVNTSRSRYGRFKKTFRHEQMEGLKYVELPVDFKGSKQVGDFFLYAQRELDMLKTIII